MVILRSQGLLSIQVNTNGVENFLRSARKELPLAMNRGMRRVAKIYAKSYLRAAKSAGITPWTGRSFAMLRKQSNNPERIGRNAYGVLVPGHMVALDEFQGVVSLKRGRSISRWAKSKLGKTRGAVFVRRHPWIDEGNHQARKSITEAPREVVRQARKIARRGA